MLERIRVPYPKTSTNPPADSYFPEEGLGLFGRKALYLPVIPFL